MESPQPNFEIQEQIRRLLNDRPDLRRNLQEMVAWEVEQAKKNSPYALGWLCTEVHTLPAIVSSLNGMGLVDLISQSRSRTEWRLHSLEDTQVALELDEPDGQAREPIDPADLFNLVVGHEQVKRGLRFILLADKPIHAILTGPPGTAKTLMLQDIARLPGAYFYMGSTTTKAGLVGLLLQEHPAYLILDELDKMGQADMSPLLNLMEGGLVTRLQHGHHDRVQMDTRVFAAANSLVGIMKSHPALMSRLQQFHIVPYTEAQFVHVASVVLEKREGQGPEMAKLIATEVVKYSTDIRAAVRVASAAKGNPHQVFEVLNAFWPNGRKS